MVKRYNKITSGSNKHALNEVDNLYKKIVAKGTFRAKSIRVAEAAKVLKIPKETLILHLLYSFF